VSPLNWPKARRRGISLSIGRHPSTTSWSLRQSRVPLPNLAGEEFTAASGLFAPSSFPAQERDQRLMDALRHPFQAAADQDGRALADPFAQFRAGVRQQMLDIAAANHSGWAENRAPGAIPAEFPSFSLPFPPFP